MNKKKIVKTKVSEVKIIFITPQNGLLGFASVLIDDKLRLNSIAIFRKLNGEGYRLTYPTKSSKENNYIFHPITKDLALGIEEAIFTEISNLIESSNYNEKKEF